ncbi:YtxH domain-containing protein [Neobacillus sp. OS1-32]|uniref:YtxH domain-containing protein n=1 Tax=Neobacillus sp. OS1-32 TaxID=3070682 RepID=UPI0027E05C7B|nr:YtxH domain-containing protein [Neobacillus sp. OS1-32]WML28692.1 YtxH domain-containing protein [Neobacillus sp. OS1-32]
MKKNQFWKGMLLGAIAGGAISLFDKDTREIMKDNVQKSAKNVYKIIRHPGETAAKIKSTIEQVSEDFSYIAEKVDEFRELTPQVTEIIKETKDTFTKSDDSEGLEDLLEDKVPND